MVRRLAIAAVTMLVGACSSLQPDPGEPARRAAASGACHAEAVQWAIGQEATPEVAGRVWRESKSGLIRMIAPRQAVTSDFRADRVNIEVDAGNNITAVRCG